MAQLSFHSSRLLATLASLIILLAPRPATAAPEICAAPWQRLDRNLAEVARPIPIGLLTASTLPPVLLSPTGGDHSLRVFAQTDLGGSYRPKSITVLTPYVVLPTLALTWTSAALLSKCRLQKAPAAMLQAATWTLLSVGLTKWITGRTWPTGGRDQTATDRLDHPEDAQTYSPFRMGLAAFPSGHTAVMFALAAALRASSPELGTWRYLGYPIALGVGFGMWFGDHHWASDILSGAMIGEALGRAAGRAWLPAAELESFNYWILPLPSGGAVGASGHF